MRRKNPVPIIAGAILATLPDESQALLNTATFLSSSNPRIPKAGLVVEIASLYSMGHSPDQIVETLFKRQLFPAGTSEVVLRKLVLPVRLQFLLCSLGLDYYWNANGLILDLRTEYVATLLKDGVDEQAIVEELRIHWQAESESLYLKEARNCIVGDTAGFDVDSFEITTSSLLTDVEKSLAKETIPHFPERLLERYPHLPSLIRTIAGLRQLKTTLVPEMKESLATYIRALSVSETDLLEPDIGDRLINESLQRTPSCPKDADDKLGVVCEFIGGSEHIPNWVDDYVFGSGGRIRHGSVGPIPYFIFVLEHFQDLPSDRVGLCAPEKRGATLALPLVFTDSNGGEFVVEYKFNARLPGHLHTLMLLVASKQMRLDILRVESTGELHLLKAGVLDFTDEFILPMKKEVLDSLINRYRGQPQEFVDAFAHEIRGHYPDIGFKSSEFAKVTSPRFLCQI